MINPNAKLFIVRSKERPRNGILCSESKLHHWVKAIEIMGDTPDVQEVSLDEIEDMIVPNTHIFN